MRSPRYFRLLDALDTVVLAPPPRARIGTRRPTSPPATGVCGSKVKAAEAAEGHDRDAALHQVRKAAKRLRYVAAATGELAVAGRPRPSRNSWVNTKTAWSAATTCCGRCRRARRR